MLTPHRVNDVREKNKKEDIMKRPTIKEKFPKGTTLRDIHKVITESKHLFNYAQSLDHYIDYLEDKLSSYLGENELGVSDVARGEHGALHAVGKCNASGQDTTEPSATDVDGALEKIIDGGNRFYCKNKFIEVDGDIVGDCFEQCDKCKSMKPS